MPQDLTDSEMLQEQAALHALGALGQHEARALETIMGDGVPELVESVRTFDAVVAALGLGTPEKTPPAGLRAKLLATLDAPASADQASNQEFFIVRGGEGDWMQVGDGVLMKELFVNRERGTATSLLRILPGGRVPAHRHPSIEEIFVIDGDCQINSETLGPGDYRCAQPGTADRILTSVHGTTVLVLGASSLEFL